MKAALWRKCTTVTVLVGLLVGTAACGEGGLDEGFIRELLSTWLPEVVAYGVLGTSGDQSLDAIFEAGSVLKDIEEADRLQEQAVSQNDPALMEQAIDLRPNDTGIRLTAVEWYTGREDYTAARNHLRASELAVLDQPDKHIPLTEQTIERLEDMNVAAQRLGYASHAQCVFIYEELQKKYDTLWVLKGNDGPSPAGQSVQSEAQRCADIAR